MKLNHAASVIMASALCLSLSTISRSAVAEPTPRAEVHPSGILILRDPLPVVEQLNDKVALALTTAMQESETNPRELAYPYVNRESDTVVVVGTSPATASEALEKLATSKAASDVLVESTVAPFSRQELEKLMDDVIGKQPEGLTVYASYPDPENNRIVVEIPTPDDAFLYRLADEYPVKAIAVRIVEEFKDGAPAARENDTSPFWGGANVNGCTTGFSWTGGSWRGMITAGHCYSLGGSASTPAQSMGSVKVNINENWRNGIGTQFMEGESVHRGDLAFIDIIGSDRTNSPTIYRGGFNSSLSRGVQGLWTRSPAQGDQYCTGGRGSGEVCGWSVLWSAPGNHTYGGTRETARRVWRGAKDAAPCIQAGDSGGPVYTVNSTGKVYAKGIISGETSHDGPCVNVFTDIFEARATFGGTLLTT